MGTDNLGPHDEHHAGRDAYHAGRDVTINNYAPPGSARHRARGDALGEDHAARLLRAERIAHAIPVWWLRVPALARVAAAAAASDPGRAARLADEARQAALSGRDDMFQVKALGQAAAAAAAGSYDLASRLADEAEDVIRAATSRDKAQYLADLSVMTGGYDPGRSARLAREAEDAASALPDWDQRDAWREAAVAQVTHDPSRAKRLIDRAGRDDPSWTAESEQDRALEKLALAAATRDPDLAMAIIGFISADPERDDTRRKVSSALAACDIRQAERIARTITSRQKMDWALRNVGQAAASRDPDGAERIARALPSGNTDWPGLARVAAVVARTDPDRAARLADEVESAMSADGRTGDPSTQGWVASAVASHDPGRAARLADQAEQAAQAFLSEDDLNASLRLLYVGEPFEDWDPDRAERIATMIALENRRAEALGRLAAVVAGTNPDRVERIARSMTGDPSVPMAKVVEALTAGQAES